MTPQEAKKVLLVIDGIAIISSEHLHNPLKWISATVGDEEVSLDGNFTADQLEAIAAWMRDPRGVAEAVLGETE